MMYAGTLNRKDALLFKHFWIVRGHQVKLEKAAPGLYYVFLKLVKK